MGKYLTTGLFVSGYYFSVICSNKILNYNFDTFWEVKQCKLPCLAASHSQMSFLVSVTPFLHALQTWRFVIAISNSGAYFFFECFVVAFALYAYLNYMFLRCIIETKLMMKSSPTVKVSMKGKVCSANLCIHEDW